MKGQLLRRFTSLVVAFPLYALYCAMVYGLGAGGILIPVGLFAESVFALEAAKLAIVLAVPRLRNGSWQLLYIFETAEILVLPGAFAVLLALHFPSAGVLVVRFVRVYFASQALLIPPFSIYKLAWSMRGGGGAGSVLVSAVLQFGLVSYLLELATVIPAGPAGLEGLGVLMLPSSGSLGFHAGFGVVQALIAIAGAAIYVSTMAYGVTDFGGSGLSPRTVALSSLGTLAAAAWVLGTSSLGSVSLTLASGDFALLGAVWWLTRG